MRYVAFQAPGWVLAAWVAWWLVAKAGLAPWLAALGWALFVIKDFALYPWLRDAYAVGDPAASGAARGPHGRRARAARAVGLRAGRRRALARRARPGLRGDRPGARVRVREVRGLTLIVESC